MIDDPSGIDFGSAGQRLDERGEIVDERRL
jgi:hypothetical protein